MPKKFSDVIDLSLMAGSLIEMRSNLRNNLRDYAAHAVMRLEGRAEAQNRLPTARELFDELFGDIPAQGEKK